MSGVLAQFVHLYDGDGVAHVFAPGDTPPSWAAARISNPKVWVASSDAGVVENRLRSLGVLTQVVDVVVGGWDDLPADVQAVLIDGDEAAVYGSIADAVRHVERSRIPALDVEPEPALDVEPEPALDVEPEPALDVEPEPALDVEPEPARRGPGRPKKAVDDAPVIAPADAVDD